MNKFKKNVVIVGFNEEERNSISYPVIENGEVHFCNSISEAILYQGYMLIIDNSNNNDLVLLDNKYRKSFNKFERILIYNKNYKWKYNKWNRFEKVNRDIFNDYSFQFSEEWDKYKDNKKDESKQLLSGNKLNKLNKFYSYLKDYKNIKTDKICNELNINEKKAQRYMNELNDIYHNIGYDYSLNEWYFIW